MRISHVGWNIFGLSAPLLVAVFAVPNLISRIGTERFGLLSLAWGLIGYAGVLDLGIGRALTQMVSSKIGGGKINEAPVILATAIRITLLTGLIGFGIISLFAILGGDALIKTAETSRKELFYSTLILAVALPMQALSATYRGLNEAYLNFMGINFLRICLGIINSN